MNMFGSFVQFLLMIYLKPTLMKHNPSAAQYEMTWYYFLQAKS